MSDSTTRTITWDEENRMVMLNDDGYVSRYTYDFSGTRVIKSHGPQESVYINGSEQGLDYHDADNYTLYVSPYLIVNNERFTKHYYAGTQRIASKVGSGDFYNVYGVNGFHLTAGDKDYKERLEQIEEGVKEYYNANGIPPGEPTMKGSNADPYVADVALPNAELGDYSVPTDWPTNVKFNEPGDVPGPVVQFEDEDQGDVKAGYGFESDNLYEGDWFFFHTDHLGSTSYLTDTAGNVSQFVCYTPYGEAIVDEHLTTYENPFKFSGKELDDITGLYDHGARSRNPVSTLWYGIDPLWEKYSDFSPYNYCAGNPVKLVDPDGRKLRGGFTIINRSSETLWFGSASGSDGKEEILYTNPNTNNFLKLEPGQKLVPYQDGDIKKAKIYDIKTGKVIPNGDVYAFDVDYLQLQEGQTLTDQEGNRYNTDINDKDAVTPVSSWTKDKDYSDHKSHGDLKMRASAKAIATDNYFDAGTITFTDNNKKGEKGSIKCDADNGGFFFNVNIFSPTIFPHETTLPHSDEQ